MLKDITNFTIRFNEVDSLGIVWHGHYVTYFEIGRESFGKKYGITYMDVKKNGVIIPVVHCQCDYKQSLKYGDTVNIETRFVNTSAAKIIFEYIISHPDRGLIATGKTIQVFTDLQGELQLNNPIFFENWKKNYNLENS
ncbi:thioesterase family protein [Apibacter sp. HY039]|uniref:acyl-CoA thioesterase n=1 Tax=Apibacter sp. HY039 TaxID=2501476 RepID=UPI000FEBC8F9|nr:acyl-CoA thioesterase [Apibacter sp. HY039]